MLDLIERLEKAESGSRLLDAAIFKGLGGPLPSEFMGVGVDLKWQDDGSALFPIGEMQVRYNPPAYTTSLDAIVALIGEKLPGWTWQFQSPGWAELDVSTFVGRQVSAQAATVPLAACIALLRALQTQEQRHG